MQNEEFQASNGWLEKFKRRHDITGKTICGASASVPIEAAENWKNKLAQYCARYLEKDIFNLVETGLFYCTLAKKNTVLEEI